MHIGGIFNMSTLTKQMAIMQVKSGYSELYRYKPYLKIPKNKIKSKKEFVNYLRELTLDWKEGDYFIRNDEGTFAYFNIREGRIELRRTSNSGKRYLCWEKFRN